MKIPVETAESLPGFPEFRDIDMQHQTAVDWFFARHEPAISEYTFTNLFVWRSSRPIWLGQADDSLFFLADSEAGNSERKVVVGPPVGKISLLDIEASLGVELGGFVRIPRETADMLKSAGLKVAADRDNSDYVYAVADLASLAGRRYHKKCGLCSLIVTVPRNS